MKKEVYERARIAVQAVLFAVIFLLGGTLGAYAQCNEIAGVELVAPAAATIVKKMNGFGVFAPADTTIVFTASASGATPATAYEWYVNGILQIDSIRSSFVFSTPTVEGVYSVYAAAVNACTESNAVRSKQTLVHVTKTCPHINPVKISPDDPITVYFDADGNLLQGSSPSVMFTATSVPSAVNVDEYRWYVGTEQQSETSNQFTFDVPFTKCGDEYKIHVRAANIDCGNDRKSNPVDVSISRLPDQPAGITGNTPVCAGTTNLTYSVTNPAEDVTYQWSLPAGWTLNSGQGSASIKATASATGGAGNISVTPKNSCGDGTPRTMPVTVETIPTQPSAITAGTASPVCASTTGLTYSVTNVTGITYAWSVPTGWSITAGQNTNSITVKSGTAGGNITVTPNNSCNSGTQRTLAVTVNAAPNQPSAITAGTASPVCVSTSGLKYSVTNVTGVTYTWSVPTGWSITAGQNTNSITVTSGTAGGSIAVTPKNSCGNTGTQRTLAVTVTSAPKQPGAISGATTVCTGLTGISYSVTNVTGVTYEWSLPTGWTGSSTSNSIAVTASNTTGSSSIIKVRAKNSCSTSDWRSTPSITVRTGACVKKSATEYLFFLRYNLGATTTVQAQSPTAQAASSIADSRGDLYQWGRKTDGHEKRSSACYTPNNCSGCGNNCNIIPTSLDKDGQIPPGSNPYGKFIRATDGARDWRSPRGINTLWYTNNPCPDGYRIATGGEFNYLVNSDLNTAVWAPSVNSGYAPGYLVRPVGATSYTLFLPVTGQRQNATGSITNTSSAEGYAGRYWSYTPTADNTVSYYMYFGSSGGLHTTYSQGYRALGFAVRCISI